MSQQERNDEARFYRLDRWMSRGYAGLVQMILQRLAEDSPLHPSTKADLIANTKELLAALEK